MIFEDAVVAKEWISGDHYVYLQEATGVVPLADQVLLRFRSGKKVLYDIIEVKPLLSPTADGKMKAYKFAGKYWFKCLLKLKGTVK